MRREEKDVQGCLVHALSPGHGQGGRAPLLGREPTADGSVDLEIERYVQNHVTGPVPAVSGREEETYFDGYSLGWWHDRAAFDETMVKPGWQALVKDGDNVFDMRA